LRYAKSPCCRHRYAVSVNASSVVGGSPRQRLVCLCPATPAVATLCHAFAAFCRVACCRCLLRGVTQSYAVTTNVYAMLLHVLRACCHRRQYARGTGVALRHASASAMRRSTLCATACDGAEQAVKMNAAGAAQCCSGVTCAAYTRGTRRRGVCASCGGARRCGVRSTPGRGGEKGGWPGRQEKEQAERRA